MDEYLPMFLAECREHLQELNLAVVRLEEAPGDRGTIDEIFRIAHSLKGMSATMGFEGMAALTHQMEDVFELLRQRGGALGEGVVNVVLECLDALSASIDHIDTERVEKIDPGPLVERLQALVRAGDAPVRRRLQVTVTLGEDCMMPSVRAFMVLRALADHGDIEESSPAEDAVDAFEGRTIEMTLESEEGDAVLQAAARAIEDVADVTVAEVLAETVPLRAVDGGAADEAAASSGPAAHSRPSSSTVRVDAERLDQLMHLMGEVLVHRTAVEALAAQADVPGLGQALQELTRSSQTLQQMVMQIRMIPVEAVFMRFPRLVRDVSTKLDKDVDLKIVGQETELDRTVVDALGDPLVHLVRNALDHGLESPEDRVAAGKPQTGTLVIAARHAGGSIVISVRDDGRGVDPAKVGARAVQRGLIGPEQAAVLDAAGAIELLFAPGFSTAETVGDLSGRGVGMDAVREQIRRLGGEVVVTSVTGEGTAAEIRLPLTLAIMSALLVESDGRPYGIPLNRVERTMRMKDQTIRCANGRRMLVLDDTAIPVRSASDAFAHGDADRAEETHLVLVRAHERTLALAVSHLVGQVELVTRSLPPGIASRDAAVSGGAVMSSGDIVLIADCDALIQHTTTSPVREAA